MYLPALIKRLQPITNLSTVKLKKYDNVGLCIFLLPICGKTRDNHKAGPYSLVNVELAKCFKVTVHIQNRVRNQR